MHVDSAVTEQHPAAGRAGSRRVVSSSGWALRCEDEAGTCIFKGKFGIRSSGQGGLCCRQSACRAPRRAVCHLAEDGEQELGASWPLAVLVCGGAWRILSSHSTGDGQETPGAVGSSLCGALCQGGPFAIWVVSCGAGSVYVCR